MKVTIDQADPASLVSEWPHLTKRAVNKTPFRSPGWIGTWAPMAAARCKLLEIRGTVGDRTVAIALVGMKSSGFGTGLTARIFEANDLALDDIYVEYNDILLTEGAPQNARRLILEALVRQTGAQSIVLRNAVPALRQAAIAAGRDMSWVCRVVTENPCYGAVLAEPSPLSRNTRQQIKRSARMFEERGPLTIEVARDEGALRRLVGLHDEVWKARGQTGAFSPPVREFHERLLARSDADAEILTVLSGDRPIGMLYNLLGTRDADGEGGTVHNYQSGFVLEDDNRLKPGLVTHSLAMTHYAQAGYAAYDMMAGESRYKQSLGTAHKRLSTVELERPSWRQRMRGVARNVRR